ncbi:MAG: carbamoyltransferase [Deltaproteobacteria bacterium]|nr:carbamoyltransferase [Deltaproteobacteria bacterium]
MKILGISAFYHDSAAALIENEKIIAAAQEERFTRKKHDSNFPTHAIHYCLEEAHIELQDIDYIVFYDKPYLKFERLLETYLAFAPRGFKSFSKAIPIWIKEKLFQKKLLKDEFKKFSKDLNWNQKLLFAEHHQSHAASAFFPSPFEEAIILTMDGVGEWATTSVAIGKKNSLEVVKELHFPHSLGLLYSAFTYYTGFKVNSGEYKVMGLAPYGNSIFKDLILEKLVHVKQDGTFRLNMDYFDYCTDLRMTNNKFHKLFGTTPRKSDEPLTQRHMDLAASIQAAIEEIILKMTQSLYNEYKIENLCLAGGVALNCVANGKILRDQKFKNIWIQPAAGDAGGALGAAYCCYYLYKNQPRSTPHIKKDKMQGGYLGPQFPQNQVENDLKEAHAKYITLNEDEIIDQTAQALQEGKAVGWFQGRMEFGPRALGNRSILGDARNKTMQKNLNLKVKFRESFRPFAPSVIREEVSNWFELDYDSPYMLLVDSVKNEKQLPMSEEQKKLFGIEKLNIHRSEIPAITHIDYSARIQTVHQDTNPRYHKLISKFKEKTGCPVLVNTSFNVRGEPIVCTPKDAFRCFMGTDLDILVVENCFLKKEEQSLSLKEDYKHKFELD